MNVLVALLVPVAVTVFAEAHPDKVGLLSDKRICGLQHTDEYYRTEEQTKISSADEYPWLAGLIYKFIGDGTKAILCSGSLINRRYVLTAAQCLTRPQITTLEAVRLGEHNLKTKSDCFKSEFQENQCYNYVDYGIEERIPHANYSSKTGQNDIALLRLDRSIEEYQENIRPICLPEAGTNFAMTGDTLQVSGWGRKADKGAPSDIKKKVLTVLITNRQCGKEFNSRPIYETQMCTTDLKNNTMFTCEGDAGAPVMYSSKGSQWHIEGISSYGRICGTGIPEVHTKVSKYLPWIAENMKAFD